MKENTLEEFLKVVKSNKGRESHLPSSAQYLWYGNRINNIIAFENLKTELYALPFMNPSITLLHENPTIIYNEEHSVPSRPSTYHLLTAKSIELINDIYSKDFELLGYDKL